MSLRPSIISQNFPGSCAPFTEKELPDQTGKVFVVTGANAGVGRELARILYGAQATVYLACRTESKARSAMEEIEKSTGNKSQGRLEFLRLDLADLATVKPAVDAFLAKEQRLDVLFNNAGVMLPPPEQKTTTQGYDMQLGTNCLGPFLLTELLTPILKKTAKDSKKNDVRVVWVGSMAAEIASGRYGVDMDNIDGKSYRTQPGPMTCYGNSKAGSYLYGVEYARRHRSDGIVSVALNPGNLQSDLYRSVDDQSMLQRVFLNIFTHTMLHPSVYGAYTELFAGLSPAVTMEKTGAWIGPWGRFFDMRKDVAQYGKTKEEGGLGGAERFWKWSEEQVRSFL